MAGTSGAFTWQEMQKSRAWQVAQLGDTPTGVAPSAGGGWASCPCASGNDVSKCEGGAGKWAIRSRESAVASGKVK